MDLDDEELDMTKNRDIKMAIDYFENMKEKLGCIMNDEFHSNMDLVIRILKEKLNVGNGNHIPRIN